MLVIRVHIKDNVEFWHVFYIYKMNIKIYLWKKSIICNILGFFTSEHFTTILDKLIL